MEPGMSPVIRSVLRSGWPSAAIQIG
jgi:hypothetical protein